MPVMELITLFVFILVVLGVYSIQLSMNKSSGDLTEIKQKLDTLIRLMQEMADLKRQNR